MAMNRKNLAQGIGVPTVLGAGATALLGQEATDTIGQVAGATDVVIEAGNSLLNPLFNNPGFDVASSALGGGSALFLTNSLLKDIGLQNLDGKRGKKDYLRYALNATATVGGVAYGSVLAPYLVAGGLAYATGKHGWGFVKGAINRTTGGVYGATVGAAWEGVKGMWNHGVNGAKGNQWTGKGLGNKLKPGSR